MIEREGDKEMRERRLLAAGCWLLDSTIEPRRRSFLRPRGSILILTLGVVVFLTGLLLVFSRQMRVEALASENLLRSVEADAVAHGAAQHVLNRLVNNQVQATLDTEIQSEATTLGDGQFWIVRPNPDDEHKYAYGVVDEASKLNINTASNDMLLLLPGMTPELAASIVDWRDADSTVTNGVGAESEYYMQLPEPYNCKNSPFETLDELLLVKGATRDLLYGVDANRNGVVDASENDSSSPLSGFNGQMQCGLCKYLTVYSAEPNLSQTGTPRTYVGDKSAKTMAALTTLLKLSLPAARVGAVTAQLRNKPAATNLLDFYFKSGLKIDEFTPIADLITTAKAPIQMGLINVNTAPREVLRCLPGLEDSDIDLIIAGRTANALNLSSVAWLAAFITAPKAAQMGGMITTHSSQFSADIVGVCGNGRSFKRAKYVFDIRYSPARIVYRKDMTNLGWPLSPAILESLRAGIPVGSSSTSGAGSFSLGSH